MPITHQDVVFVYGALRSGTTVFRLMLDAHPRMNNPGEMDFLFDHLMPDTSHPTGWRYEIDALKVDRIFRSSSLKLSEGLDGLDLLDDFLNQLKSRAPGKTLSINLHRHIDRVFAILPQTKAIHMLRDPRDVARSSIQMGWAGTLYHGVAHWIATDQAWEDGSIGVDQTQLLELSYEGLFRGTEEQLRRVCAFLDLPFDPDMLRYHENTTYAAPDPSLIEQWKRKCAPEALQALEQRAAAMMDKRGYAVSQPPAPLGTAQRLNLFLRNKLFVWSFGMRRFGIITYWAEKLPRWTRLKPLHRHFKLRMQRITAQHLK